MATTAAAALTAPMAIPALAPVVRPAEEEEDDEAVAVVPLVVLVEEEADVPVAVESEDDDAAEDSEASVAAAVSAEDVAVAVGEVWYRLVCASLERKWRILTSELELVATTAVAALSDSEV